MKTVFALVAAAMLTLPALADFTAVDHAASPIYSSAGMSALPLDMTSTTRAAGVVYSNITAGADGYVAAPADTGSLGFDDYDSINDADITLDSFRFVGGVTNAGEVLFFDFYETDGSYVDGFGIQFDEGGNFIWNLTGPAGAPLDIVVPDAGIVQITADDGSVLIASTGQWFLSDNGPTVGAEDVNLYGAGDGVNSFNFELTNVPEPAGVLLLALGALVLRYRK